jgi:hypothetical protein
VRVVPGEILDAYGRLEELVEGLLAAVPAG